MGTSAAKIPDPCNGGEIDDRALALFFHIGNGVFATQKGCFQIKIDLPVKRLFRLRDGITGFGPADIIDQNINFAEMCDTGLDHVFHLRPIHHIAGGGGAAFAFAFYDGLCFRHSLCIDINQKYMRALPCEQDGCGFAISPAGTNRARSRNNRNFFCEVEHQFPLLSFFIRKRPCLSLQARVETRAFLFFRPDQTDQAP